MQVADDSTIGTCVSHLYMPEDAAPQSMRTCIALFLANTANHSEPLAQRVVAGEALPAVASLVGARSTKPALRAACLKVRSTQLAWGTKRHLHTSSVTTFTLLCLLQQIASMRIGITRALVGCRQMLSQVAKHSTELATMVVEQRVMPAVLHCLTDEDHAHTRLAAASLVQEVSRRTPELAQVRLPCLLHTHGHLFGFHGSHMDESFCNVEPQVQCYARGAYQKKYNFTSLQ